MKPSVFARSGWSVDLLLAAVVAVGTAGVLLSPGIGWPIEQIAGILLLVFLPGYAFICALFPEQPSESSTNATVDPRTSGPDWIVRLILSLVSSLIIVALVGVLLGIRGELRLVPAIGALVGVTLVGITITAVRRSRMPQERRANPIAGRTLRFFSAGTKLQNAVLVIAVCVLVSTIAVAGAGVAPSQGESFSETYLLTEGENGELVAEGYPTTFVAGDGHPLYFGIENHEHRSVSYEVIVVTQDIGSDGSIENQQLVDQFNVELAHGENALLERQIEPTMTGEGHRVQFLVYKDTSPDEVDLSDSNSADQTLQIWIDVVERVEDR